MQIYKPGMGRLNSQPNSKSSNAKYDDDEKFKAGETEEQDKEEKPFKDGKNSGFSAYDVCGRIVLTGMPRTEGLCIPK